VAAVEAALNQRLADVTKAVDGKGGLGAEY